jgi:hypothetical protein
VEDVKSIDYLIDEWFRMRCDPKFFNIPIKHIENHLKDLFLLLKDNGYKFEDLGTSHANKVRKMCQWSPGTKPRNKEWWLAKIEHAWLKASSEVFPSDVVDKNISEDSEKDGNPSGIPALVDNTKATYDRSYDEEFMTLMGVPDEFRDH